MIQQENFSSDLPELGFVRPKQQRGIFKWILAASIVLNIWQVKIFYSGGKNCTDEKNIITEKYEKLLLEIIAQQHKNLDTLNTIKNENEKH